MPKSYNANYQFSLPISKLSPNLLLTGSWLQKNTGSGQTGRAGRPRQLPQGAVGLAYGDGGIWLGRHLQHHGEGDLCPWISAQYPPMEDSAPAGTEEGNCRGLLLFSSFSQFIYYLLNRSIIVHSIGVFVNVVFLVVVFKCKCEFFVGVLEELWWWTIKQ